MMDVGYLDDAVRLHGCDVFTGLARIVSETVQTCITSPPYWGLRDYGVAGQLGLEPTPAEYVAKMVQVFREVRRVLKDDGTLWLNLGDSYCSTAPGTRNAPMPKGSVENAGQWANLRPSTPAGLKPKDLVGIPWRVAFALQADGWYLRSDIIWAKPNPMPESVTDRPTKAHEYLFLFAKSERYFYDQEAIKEPCLTGSEAVYDPGTDGLGGADRKTGKTTRRFAKRPAGWNDGPTEDDKLGRYTRPLGEKGSAADATEVRAGVGAKMGRGAGWRTDPSNWVVMRNKRTVWTVGTEPYPGAHFATFPEKLIEPCILAGSRPGDTVLDPFAGSGTTLAVSKRLGRQAIGIELNPEYIDLAMVRVGTTARSLF